MSKEFFRIISQRIRSPESGSTAIEFAIAFPVLLLLLMGIIEFSLIVYASSVLDGAVTAAAREGRTGFSGGTNRTTYIDGILQSRTQPLMASSLLQITSTVYTQAQGGFSAVQPVKYVTCSNAAGATQNTNPPSCASLQNPGGPGDVVQYAVSYPWQIFTPFLGAIIGNNGVFTLTSSALVQNEIFNVTPIGGNPNPPIVSTVSPSIPGSSDFPATPGGGGCAACGGPPTGYLE